ncbi:MAG: glycoside hydrolase family 127 protein [Prevotella sp.]|nr:glycoside hydrolase family 127 protein [Prevotella sp.]
MRKMLITIGVIIALTGPAAHAQAPTKQELLDAMNASASYAMNVLLDEHGKSRCDYNMIQGKWFPYEEPWHTGQLILGLVQVYEVTGNQAAIEAAKRAGNWWISLEIKDNPALKGMVGATHGDDIGNDQIVFATVSDGTHGLFELSRVTGDKKYARVASNAIEWMYDHMYDPKNGICYDLADLKTGGVLTQNSPFYKDKPNQTLEDVSRPNTEGSPFKDAYLFTGKKKFLDGQILLSNSLIDKQYENGIWMRYMPNHLEVSSFHPRFNLWYAESLIETYELTKEKKYLEAAARTLRTYAKVQKKDGTIFYNNYTDGKPSDEGSICGSAVAFAGSLWIRMAQHGYTEFSDNYERSIRWILTNRYAANHPDKNLRGAVINTRMRVKKKAIWLTQRDIGTSFGMRLMADYYQLKYNDKK